MTETAKNDGFIGLINITPTKLRCSFGGCPAVYETEDGEIVIIGKKASAQIEEKLKNNISSDEWVVVVNRELLANIKTK
ncbi:MAG: hypothetical protein KTR19_02145 [Hyphomicrobiales bacterium]|nr:hypothetical protein [Hyphomicrobiales bacterium]